MVRGWFPRHQGRNTKLKKFDIKFFRFDTLRIATKNFSTLLGRGDYGSLFKGSLADDDGRSVAILRLHKPYRDGFLEMVEFMSHLRHINLIQIIGCCVENDEQLLVCEFAENGSVWHHLQSRKRSTFDWEIRAGVCIGIARGLSYLHEEIDPRVIHRDIKPSNILLDANFVPKIVDFDLVDLVDDRLYIGTGEGTAKGRPRFEYPFSGPDNMLSGQLTEKVDVYGFGVCMLEIITGRNSIDMASKQVQEDVWILHWVKRMRNDGTVLKIVDPMLTHFPEKDVVRFIDVALMCTHPISEQRPSMFEVVHMLYGRCKSDQEISQMATMAAAAAAEPSKWSNPYASAHTPVISMYSPTPGTSEKADVEQSNNNASTGIDCQELGETTGCFWSAIVPIRKQVSKSKPKCSSPTDEALQLAETSSASSSNDVRTCYERSMEKIMRYQLTIHDASKKTTMQTTQTIQERKQFREVVYPPLPSGEYRPPRVLNSERQ